MQLRLVPLAYKVEKLLVVVGRKQTVRRSVLPSNSEILPLQTPCSNSKVFSELKANVLGLQVSSAHWGPSPAKGSLMDGVVSRHRRQRPRRAIAGLNKYTALDGPEV